MFRSAKTIALLLLTMTLLVGCSKESIDPVSQNDQPILSASTYNGHHRPDVQCGPSEIHNIVDGSQAVIGSAEIFNNNDQIYMLISMKHGWLLNDLKLFVGPNSNLPKGSNGLAIEEFPSQFALDNLVANSTFTIPLRNLPPCTDISVYTSAKQLNFFGNEVASTTAWIEGTSVLNGQYFTFCPSVCSNQQSLSPANITL